MILVRRMGRDPRELPSGGDDASDTPTVPTAAPDDDENEPLLLDVKDRTTISSSTTRSREPTAMPPTVRKASSNG